MEIKHALDDAAIRVVISAALGISQQAITNWKSRGVVPVEHCTAIEKATNGAVTRKDLRPDDWQAIWPELIDKAVA
jgi:DNA-binding transcriptional regulator YdaS (Cro superfamily)